jgi:hypothetical protein
MPASFWTSDSKASRDGQALRGLRISDGTPGIAVGIERLKLAGKRKKGAMVSSDSA